MSKPARGARPLTALQLTRAVMAAAEYKKARDVVRLDVRKRTSIADYFVVCEGDTDRQVRAIADGIMTSLREQGVHPLRLDGYQEAAWTLLDYDSVIVHIFLPGERSYYDLESLWRTTSRAVASAWRARARPSLAATRTRRVRQARAR